MPSKAVLHKLMFLLTAVLGVVGAFASTPGLGKAAGGAAVVVGLLTDLRTALESLIKSSDDGPPGGPVMALVIAGLFGASMACGGCAHVPKPVVDTAVCAKDSVAHDVANVIAEVTTDLSRSDFKALLEGLAGKAGMDVVNCAVSEILAVVHGQVIDAPHDELAKTREAHARAWLGL